MLDRPGFGGHVLLSRLAGGQSFEEAIPNLGFPTTISKLGSPGNAAVVFPRRLSWRLCPDSSQTAIPCGQEKEVTAPLYVLPPNFSHVPPSFCCPTPGFDQSHTPAGKILLMRTISSAVKATL